ncbi:LicD family protein [Leucobacter denitrificans]|uniref:LicD family protein n=1 Tax=Leucobacter denitrificans TaxID=683042 RepID=A0A7G9S3J8_9MICO|nr:LicD family protein [Leucobacter denitrificans]QNN62423.1 LicD family protein [Leucobacter denitrificans]
MTFTADAAGITLPDLESGTPSVDVCFGNDRVWSIDLSQRGSPHGRILWPDPIRPYLVGFARVSLRDSRDHREIASVDARFTDADVEARILDGSGIPLAINKWGRLGKTLELGNPGVQERILDRTEEVIEHLSGMGLRPFIVGGTLLGAIREGALLPHDDDADVAYFSRFTNPVDVAVEGFEIGRNLIELGYELVRHSATHMQLYFRNENGDLDHYVDVFSAFFTEDGYINQPFHVRGEMSPEQMLPFSSVEIDGRPFPAPANPESWLIINYDENWRTPIPGYRLETPRPTIRRFQNWFGSFHRDRDFWNEYYQSGAGHSDDPWLTGRSWILAQEADLQAQWLINLGSGSGALSQQLIDANQGRQVVSADYSQYALDLTTRQVSERHRAMHANLFRTHSLSLPLDANIVGPFDLVANHLIDQLGTHARPQTMRLIRMSLRSGGSAFATLYGRPDPEALPNPTARGLAVGELARIVEPFGITIDKVRLAPAIHEKRRDPYGVKFSLNSTISEEKK